HQYKKCMVFCNTKSMVDELSAELQKEGYPADGLHGDLTQKQRDSVMGRFRSGSVQILIATDIAARGIDVDDVEAVFNYDIPQETEYYVHRIGRTGRAGREGTSHTLCRSKDFRKLRDIEQICHTTMEEKKIPAATDIRQQQEQSALDAVLQILAEGHSGKLIPVIQRYCEEQGIPMEAFAAACLKKELGEEEELNEIEVNLPDPGKKKRERRPFRRDDKDDEGRERRRGRRDERDGHRDRRDDHRDRRDDRDGHRDRRDDRRDRRESRFFEKYRDGHEEKRSAKHREHSFFGERSERGAEKGLRDRKKDIKDIRRDGSPKRSGRGKNKDR
ncbi:MAG: C-terminal helicase domain-containing protein, partial [Lachnospiraceae bacterium]|nr:C-terminal helicase domain-containing protein [Lachnospiraceae bacterium]